MLTGRLAVTSFRSDVDLTPLKALSAHWRFSDGKEKKQDAE
jgi:hypothetical protein